MDIVNKFHAPISCIIEFKNRVGVENYKNVFRQMQFFTIIKEFNYTYQRSNNQLKEITVKPSKKYDNKGTNFKISD